MINRLLITGCTQGLGVALALQFAEAGCYVYAVGRHQQPLLKLVEQSSSIHPIIADITTEVGRQQINEKIDKNKPFSIIHNAAIAEPTQFTNLSESSLRAHFETNCIAPLLITQQLLPFLKKNQRILHISSGAAKIPLSGLLPYCITKSALEHSTHCLNVELNSRGIYCTNLLPGMIDTPMQLRLRNAEEKILPNREFYIEALKEKKLTSPDVVAKFVVKIMLKTNNILFSETSWDIYNAMHHQLFILPQSNTLEELK